MTRPFETDFLVIGAGPAGYTAAIYAARANLKPILVTGLQPGGQLTITTDVENFPGFAATIQGPWLMEQMEAQAKAVGTKMVSDLITTCEDLGEGKVYRYRFTGDSGDIYLAKTAVIATGAQAKWLGLPSEARLQGAGVSACATCDGYFFRNKHVAVIGGGNTAVEEALYLTRHANLVTLIHRRDKLRAERIMQERLFKAKDKIEVLWNRGVEEILADGSPPTVSGLRLKNLETGEIEERAVDGVFIAIGHQPNTAPFRDFVRCDAEGYIVTPPGSTRTSRPGIFAAGDVQDRVFRQAVTAAGSGCMAALEAERFISGES